MDIKIIRDGYGPQTMDNVARRIGNRLYVALGVLGVMSTVSLALGIRWLCALFFTLLVCCAFVCLYSKDLDVLAYLVAVVSPIMMAAIMPSAPVLDVSLYLALPAAIALLIFEFGVVRSEVKSLNLPGIKETMRRGLRFKVYPPSVYGSMLVLFFYLFFLIPDYYNLSGVELVQARIMVVAWLVIYYVVALKTSVIGATVMIYGYFIFGLRLFWNIDTLLYLPLFVILTPPMLTMRYVKAPAPSHTPARSRLPRSKQSSTSHKIKAVSEQGSSSTQTSRGYGSGVYQRSRS
jgi:hypothetical protein